MRRACAARAYAAADNIVGLGVRASPVAPGPGPPRHTVCYRSAVPANLKVLPLSRARWRDLETLFGERGACGGCWCMWWRLPRSQFDRQKGAGNRRAFKRLVDSGETPGILAYRDGRPIGWCALGPRRTYPVLDRSRTLKQIDERPVWSVTCLFVARPHRRKGVTVDLLRAAAGHAARRGASLLEGYPVEPRTGRLPDAFAWTGLPSAFRKAGFAEVLRRSPTRPIMRLVLRAPRAGPPARARPARGRVPQKQSAGTGPPGDPRP